jgi:peptidoglycan hydrolase-like protein with peptidoglycan-binding domain
VVKFQAKYKIFPENGVVSGLTLTQFNELAGDTYATSQAPSTPAPYQAAPLQTYVYPFSGLFNRDLSFGMSGYDVQELQRILNRDAATYVANSGVGSPGRESTYFGPATRNAVIRFQNKYATSLLTPRGLSYGDGKMESYMRGFLNSLLTQAASIASGNTVAGSYTITSQISGSTNTSASAVGTISTINPSTLRAGEKMTVSGSNLSSVKGFALKGDNTTYFVWDFSSSSNTLIEFFLPSNLPAGSYKLHSFDDTVENPNSFSFAVTQ